jgi:hypothetical protein
LCNIHILTIVVGGGGRTIAARARSSIMGACAGGQSIEIWLPTGLRAPKPKLLAAAHGVPPPTQQHQAGCAC